MYSFFPTPSCPLSSLFFLALFTHFTSLFLFYIYRPRVRRVGIKHAPSSGALAQGAKQHTPTSCGSIHVRKPSGSYPSSDKDERRERPVLRRKPKTVSMLFRLPVHSLHPRCPSVLVPTLCLPHLPPKP
jgi:hypothetical protein